MALISFSMSRRSNSFVKLIPLAFILCITLQWPIVKGRIQIQPLNIIPPNLIKACNNNHECISWIQTDRSKTELDSLQKADLKTIAFLALKKIEQEATNVSTTVRMKLLNNNSAALSSDTEQALSDCSDHFIPAIELINDAVDSTVNGAFNDAIKYYATAITDFEVCYPRLKAMRTANSVGVDDYVDNHIAEVANARNALVKFIHIPLDILKVVAAARRTH